MDSSRQAWQHKFEALQKEEARRHEIMMQENARRHEQLLELIRSRFVHAREKEIAVHVPKEEKELIPLATAAEKKVGSLNQFETYQSAAVEDAEQKHQMNLQIEASRRYEVKLRDNVSKPEELLKQPPPLKHAHINLVKVNSTDVAGNTVHSSENIANFNAAEVENLKMKDYTRSDEELRNISGRPEELPRLHATQPSPSKLISAIATQPSLLKPAPNVLNAYTTSGETAASDQMKRQGKCEEYRDGNVTRQQCRNSSLYALQSPLEINNDDEVEIVKGEDEKGQPQSVKEIFADKNEPSTATPLPETVTHVNKVLSQSVYPQFPWKMQDYKFPAKIWILRLPGSDAVPELDYLKTYRLVLLGPEQSKVTIKPGKQVIVVRPYQIKSGATMEKTHACIQNPPIEIKDSTQEKEIIAILLKVNNQFIANSFPKMEFLLYSGDDPRNGIRSDEKYLELQEISDQQKVEIATMPRLQERSQDLRIQMLLRNSNLEEAYIAYNLVSDYKELRSVLGMAHPCSRFLAYEQAKLKESYGERVIAFHTLGMWQIYQRNDQLFYWPGKGRNKQQLVQGCASCLRVKEANRPRHCDMKLKLEGRWPYARCQFSTEERNLQGNYPPTNASSTIENIMKDPNLSWFKGRGQVLYNFEGQSNKARQRTHIMLIEKEVGVFLGEDMNTGGQHSTRNIAELIEGVQNSRFNSLNQPSLLKQGGSAARRLRLPEGPKGEPLPQQESPSMLPTRDVRRVWTQLKTPQTVAKGGQENRTGTRIWFKRSNLEGEEALLGKQLGTPKPSSRAP